MVHKVAMILILPEDVGGNPRITLDDAGCWRAFVTLAADLASPASLVTQCRLQVLLFHPVEPRVMLQRSTHGVATVSASGKNRFLFLKVLWTSSEQVPLQTQPPLCEKSQIAIFLTRGLPSRSAANSGIACSRTLKRPTPSGMVYGLPRHKHLRFLLVPSLFFCGPQVDVLPQEELVPTYSLRPPEYRDFVRVSERTGFEVALFCTSADIPVSSHELPDTLQATSHWKYRWPP